MLVINRNIRILERELDFSAIRAQGAGGQNINKVATAVQLRFDITGSTLPAYIKNRLLNSGDNRINRDGIIIIKAQEYRSQQRNREAALHRLQELLRRLSVPGNKRVTTVPTRQSIERRLDSKTRRGRLKRLRSKSNIL